MKISNGYLLRSVAGKNIVVSVGSDTNFNGMLTLNESGVFFWNLLKEGTTKEKMLEAVLKEYDVSPSQAMHDIDEFTENLWNSLNEDNKVSLFVRFIDIETGEVKSKIVNKNK